MAAGKSLARACLFALLGMVLCLTLGPVPASVAAEPPAGAAGWMYEPGTVVVIDLMLTAEEKTKLEAEPFEDVKGTFSLSKTDGTPDGEEPPLTPTPIPVEMRLKGNEGGSFRDLTGKAAFKLKFKKADAFLGLRKMTLNNMVEDYSLIHETLAYRAFRAAGVAAPRTGYADVRLNGDDYGLHLNLENLDKVNLERWFGEFKDPQHLYEGEYGSDVIPGVDLLKAGEGGFEVDEGDEANLDDLKALIAAANASEGSGWSSQVTPFADFQQMTRMWAVEKYIGHWDGYSGREGAKQPNNFYLYSDSAGKFQMLPWGTDLTWDERLDFDGAAGLMFDKCLADPACETLYRTELRAVGKVIDGLQLDSLAESTAKLLKPWEEADPRLEFPTLVAGAVSDTRDFIADRPAELADWLGPEPTTEASTVQRPADPLRTMPLQTLYVGRSFVVEGVLTTHLWLAEGGRVNQHVEIRTRKGAVGVCSAQARAKAIGPLIVHCPLSTDARKRLKARRLKLEIHTRFTPVVGASESATSKIIARRASLR